MLLPQLLCRLMHLKSYLVATSRPTIELRPVLYVRDICGRDVYRIRTTNVGNHIEKSRERMIVELGRDDIQKKPSILVTSKEIIVLFLFRF